MDKILLKTLISNSMASTALAFLHPALAQDSESQEEVIVTAQKREERLKDVPISVTALAASALDDSGVDQLTDLQFVSPGLTTSNQVLFGLPYMRGLGSDITSGGSEPSVALHVDGVYMPRATSYVGQFSNIERIEVLRGPQGTLYGRNATAGVINIVTRRPGRTKEGQLEASAGNDGYYAARGYASGPASDTMAIGGALYVEHLDGYYTNLSNGANLAGGDDVGVQLSTVITPSDNIEFYVRADWSQYDGSEGGVFNQLGVGNVTAAPLGGHFSATAYETYTDVPINTDRKARGLTGQATVNFSNVDLVSISSFRHSDHHPRVDVDASDLPLADFGNPSADYESFTQEVRLQSTSDSPLQWTVGAYYLKDSFHEDTAISVFFGAQAIRNAGDGDTEAYAGFGQLDWKLSPNLTASLGARYSHEEKAIAGTTTIFDATLTPPSFQIPFPRQRDSWSSLDPRFTLSYDWGPTLIYATYGTAFKSGAFNINAPGDPAVEPEEIESYEVGLKSDVFGNGVDLTVSAFHYDISNLQLQLISNTGGNQIFNAASAENYGGELELSAHVTERLDMHFGLSYLHADYTDFTESSRVLVPGLLPGPLPGNVPPSAPLNLAGNTMVKAPEVQANLGWKYQAPLSFATFGFSGNISYSDQYFFEPTNSLRQPAYTIVNSSLYLDFNKGRQRVTLWGRNITDEELLSNASRTNFGDFGIYGRPQMYGLSIAMRY